MKKLLIGLKNTQMLQKSWKLLLQESSGTWSSIEKRLELIAEREADANRKKAEAELVQLHPDLTKFVTTKISTLGLRNNLVGSKSVVWKWWRRSATGRAIDLYKVDRNIESKKAPKKLIRMLLKPLKLVDKAMSQFKRTQAINGKSQM